MGKKPLTANSPTQLRTITTREFNRHGVEEVFTRLLTTWLLRETRRPNDAPALPSPNIIKRLTESQGEAAAQEHRRQWFVKSHERRYGDGHYEDRAKLLRVALRFLKRPGVDLIAVFQALCAAHSEAARTSLRNAKAIRDRENRIKPERRARTRLLKELQAYRKRWTFPATTETAWFIDGLIAKLETPNPVPTSLGRKRPYLINLKPVRKQLAAAGVPPGIKGFREALKEEGCNAKPHNLPDALLMAVGLLTYHRA